MPPAQLSPRARSGCVRLVAWFLGAAVGLPLARPAAAQVSLTPLRHLQITPNAQDSAGVFCRTFYHPGRDRFYVVYAGRAGAASSTTMNYYRWREYDGGFQPTGRYGTLPGFGTAVGDFAMVMVDSTFFHATAGPGYTFKLSRFDDDFAAQGSTLVSLDPADGRADMLLNYVNGRLVLGALHQVGVVHPTFPMQTPAWTPVMHKWEYDLNLAALAPPVYLAPTFSAWGGSALFNGGHYYVVSQDSFPAYNLDAYEYDAAWTPLATHHLSTDGQWSQGVLWDGTWYFLAYHSGHQHNSGNITVGIYDAAWQPVYSTTITDNAVYLPPTSPPIGTHQLNANRPFLTRVGDRLYVSYDVDGYVLNSFPTFYSFDNQWQAHVQELRIDTVGGVPAPEVTPPLALSPNPAGHALTVAARQPIESVEILDAGGRLVRHLAGAGASLRVELTGLRAGVYLARARLKDGSTSEGKFVHR